MFFSVLVGVVCGFFRPQFSVQFSEWMSHFSIFSIFKTAFFFALLVLFHEIGHASACLSRSGLVGSISSRFYAGVPIFITDVSIVNDLPPAKRSAIAIAGVVFQIWLSSLFLLSGDNDMKFAASLSFMSAGFALLPVPGSDGYWFISDTFKVRLVGCFGSGGRRDAVGYSYSLLLIAITSYFSIVLWRMSKSIFLYGLNYFSGKDFYLYVILCLALYPLIVAICYLRRMIAFLGSNVC
jgi:hypothetical protein